MRAIQSVAIPMLVLATGACLIAPQAVFAANSAEEVVSYATGAGFAKHFVNANAALGMPSAQTVDPHPEFGGTFPVDPFSPPYLNSQLVSVGTGGHLAVKFAQPVWNQAGNPFGIDFMGFGNNGFQIINGDFTGGGVTDGSLFSSNPPGSSRVSVSQNGVDYFDLVAPVDLASTLDELFPTDGAGNFEIPVNPALTSSDFAGKNVSGIRALYAGSAGGTGFDVSWARDASGEAVTLDYIQYARVDVSAGRIEIDGFTAVPEPSVWALGAVALAGGLLLRRRTT